VATISGAFHQEAGRWVDSRGLMVEPATTNYNKDPVFGNAVLGTHWVFGQNGAGGTGARDTTHVFAGTHACKIVAGDGNRTYVYDDAVTVVADGASVIFTAYSWCSAANKAGIRLYDETNVVFRGIVTGGVAGQWTRLQSTWTNDTGAPATIRTYCENIAGDSATTVWFDGCQTELHSYSTSLCYGDLDWCAWSGAEDDSTSTRAGTSIITPTAGSIGAAEGSIAVWFKVDDWNAAAGFLWCTGNVNAEFDAYVAADGGIVYRINTATRCSLGAGLVTKGIWHQAVFTWKVSTDVSELYFDGELVDTGTCGGGAPTLHANLGVGYSTALANTVYDLNGPVGEFATLGSVLTAEEVAAMYALHRPLVDAGALEEPSGNYKTLAVGSGNSRHSVDSNGILTLEGKARVIRHMVIGAASWKVGAVAPTEGFEGTFPVLNFQDARQDTAHYSTWVPYRWDPTEDMEVAVVWKHDTGAKTGKVLWGLVYLAVKDGEDPAGAGETTISQLSAGNHPADQQITTTFTTKMLAANLANHDSLGLVLSRDGIDATDTLTEDARMIEVHIHFVENKLGEPT